MNIKSTLLFFLVTIYVSKPVTSKAQAINVQDSLALVDLYNSTNGPQWYTHFHWLTSYPVNTWEGLSVNGTRVTGIYLRGYVLNGHIPSSVGNLTDLEILNLSGNILSGSIPAEMGNLKNLTELYLYDNQLSGSIPSEMGDLKNLIALYLYDNQLSGSIPSELGNLENLTLLNLSKNKLSGSIPPELGILENLTILSLAGNKLSGIIPSELGKLSNLVYLQAELNNLSGTIPSELGNLENIEYLDLSHNLLNGNIPVELEKLVKAQTFYLGHNQLSGSIPTELGNLENLKTLYLQGNRFTFNGMEFLVQKFPFTKYSPQSTIHLNQNSNNLSVSVGGTLTNNTYKWFQVGKEGYKEFTGDSVFYPPQNGKYYAIVTNSICTKLTLYTDTVEYSSVLPVTIVNLKAQQQGNIIKVDWSSLTEINVGSYEIQRSLNGRDFSAIGSVTAKNNGTSQTNYTFNDLQPATGNNYYRVKVIDEDGKKTYSNIVSLNVNSDKTITLVYPVPARDVLHIQTNGIASFSLIDQSGKVLLIQNINGNGTINISGIANGFYYLKNNANSTLQKVIISR
ncbi:MAG TPA: T9SS type A sorting domain-containing protein [Panacibacter sp.]|nr:T9SS type A sorting domain-containing protein [Panacibacter sp.]